MVLTSLRTLDAADPVPVHAVNIKGRIHFKYGTQRRYPEAKIALCGEDQEGEENNVLMLAKFNVIPPNFSGMEMDTMLLLE